MEGFEECDPDEKYEEYRDEWVDRLDDAVNSLFTAFIKQGYYHNSPERLKEHIKQKVDSL